MSILGWYAFFALVTSFTAIYELLIPVMRKRKAEVGKVPDEITIYLTFFFLNMLIAPLVFFSCIVPSISDKFRAGLYTGLFPKD